MAHSFQEFVNPHLAKLLASLNIDKQFVRGEGPYLYGSDGQRYLDFIAAYGALPFGFNPPEIWEAINDVRQQGEPSFIQPSLLGAAGDLAQRLIAIAPSGLQYVTYANSGTEAVEAAIKACRAATGRLGIIAAENSFHGKTLGSLSATGRAEYQKAFGAPAEGFEFVPYGQPEAIATILETKAETIAAVILEPIQGEGGIVVPPAGYLKAVREICDRYGVLLILDEVQTGLGRTGLLFAAEREGVSPDCLTLAKALGGGIMPIGACLLGEAAYTEEFATKHSSTFAGNTLACRVGLRVLDILTRDERALIRRVADLGSSLKSGLADLAARFPHVVREVRGEGFMLGIDLCVSRESFPAEVGAYLGVLGELGFLAPVVASYCLNVEHIRVAPTLNGNSVLRVEPPLIMEAAQCDMFLAAMERTLSLLANGNTGAFIAPLVKSKSAHAVSPVRVVKPRSAAPRPTGQPEEGRFAFLVHALEPEDYPEFDETLRNFTPQELERFDELMIDAVDPFVVASTRIVSQTGATAFGEFIAVPGSTKQLLSARSDKVLKKLRQAVTLAKDRGARIVGLGGYTSIASRGGKQLTSLNVPLTTGNSYTVVLAIEAALDACRRLGLSLHNLRAAVIGASGSIGAATSRLLAEQVRELILVGNANNLEKARQRLIHITTQIIRNLNTQTGQHSPVPPDSAAGRLVSLPGYPQIGAPDEAYNNFAARLLDQNSDTTPLWWTTSCEDALAEADIIVVATSSDQKFIRPQMLKAGAVICDLSRPSNVSPAVYEERPDVLVIDGGVAAVPGKPSLGWNFRFPQGLAYACMAETMMLTLSHHYEHTSLGADLNHDSLSLVQRLARDHGFTLAGLRSRNQPLTDREWERLRHYRKLAVEGEPLSQAFTTDFVPHKQVG